jgi:hypothetical protein
MVPPLKGARGVAGSYLISLLRPTTGAWHGEHDKTAVSGLAFRPPSIPPSKGGTKCAAARLSIGGNFRCRFAHSDLVIATEAEQDLVDAYG